MLSACVAGGLVDFDVLCPMVTAFGTREDDVEPGPPDPPAAPPHPHTPPGGTGGQGVRGARGEGARCLQTRHLLFLSLLRF